MKPIHLIDEKNFAEDFAAAAEPCLARLRECFEFEPQPGIRLNCELYRADHAPALVVICHGYTESAVKFRELAYYFLQQGYSVLLYDQRGHGLSTREIDDPCTAYVRAFDLYVQDLIALTEKAARMTGAQKLYLYGHSMGGGVSARALQLYPDFFDKCVLNAPMIAIRTEGLPVWVCKAMAGFFCGIGMGKKRFFGHKPYAPGERFEVSCTTCRTRFNYYAHLRQTTPALQLNAASYRWLMEALLTHDRLMKPKNLAAIRTPLCIFTAELEASVKNDAIFAFADALPQAKLCPVPGVKHEIYRSPNADLAPYLEQVFAFFEKP